LPARSCASSSDRRGVAAAALLMLLVATPAHADFFITPFAAIKFAGDATFVDLESGASNTKFALGGMVGVLTDGLFGVEADITYVPRFFERSTGSLVARSHVFTFMGNVMVAAPLSVTQYSLRPFVSGGAGFMHINIDDVADAIPVDSNFFGINVGGGATGPLSNSLDVRFEVRWFKSVTTGDATLLLPGSALSFWRAAVGLTIR
jgi:hypothetical protein